MKADRMAVNLRAGVGSRGDRDLAHRFARGDPQAVRELYARYAGPVFTVAFDRLRNRQLAEEAVQDVFVKAWRAAASFDTERDLSPWLYQIARRSAADIARRERRRPATQRLSPSTPATELASLGDVWEAWQVRLALGELVPEERELIRLTHFVGMSQSEIADHLGIPLGTVKSRMHRAHRRLAQRLAHVRQDP
jgi:RNA polymerase sigma-70 factor (ECF subfamily)